MVKATGKVKAVLKAITHQEATALAAKATPVQPRTAAQTHRVPSAVQGSLLSRPQGKPGPDKTTRRSGSSTTLSQAKTPTLHMVATRIT